RIRRDLDASGQMDALDRFGQQAWGMLTSPAAREAFDLDREPAPLRERYGFLPAFDPQATNRCGAPAWSQRILLARRLVEAAARGAGARRGGGAAGDRRFALVGHARQRLRVAAPRLPSALRPGVLGADRGP